MTEAEVGVVQIKAKGNQGLMATNKNWGETRKGFPV
jgi:hypothetical protein